MESTDREILLEVHGKILVLEREQKHQAQELAEVRRDVGYLREGQVILQHDIANIQTSVYWGLAAIGIFLAALGTFTAVYMWIASSRKETPAPKAEPSLTPSEVMRMINEGINARLNSTEK